MDMKYNENLNLHICDSDHKFIIYWPLTVGFNSKIDHIEYFVKKNFSLEFLLSQHKLYVAITNIRIAEVEVQHFNREIITFWESKVNKLKVFV